MSIAFGHRQPAEWMRKKVLTQLALKLERSYYIITKSSYCVLCPAFMY